MSCRFVVYSLYYVEGHSLYAHFLESCFFFNCKWVPVVLMLVTQLCTTLCDPMNCSPPGSSIHGIFQARILEWVAISFCRGVFPNREQAHISCISCTGRQSLPLCHVEPCHLIVALNKPYFLSFGNCAGAR